MPITKDVVYIGPKDVKRYTWAGKKFLFPRGKSVAVEEALAYILLEHRDVFVEPDDVKDVLKAQEEELKKQEELRKAAELAEKKELIDNSGLVRVGGEIFDINKQTSATIKTWIVAEELDIDANSVELIGDEKPKQALVRVVRLALHEKNGNPETEEA